MGNAAHGFKADPFTDEFSHPFMETPYRMVVFSGFDQNNAPVYWIAGDTTAHLKSINAMKKALQLHGGQCFYCTATTDLNVDHIVPKTRGGQEALGNLVVSCKRCNQKKGQLAIEQHDPNAAQRWLQATRAVLDRRISRLQSAKH